MSKAKGGLGKGLSALIRTPEPVEEAHDQPLPSRARPATSPVETGAIAHIDIRSIKPNPFQPRADFDQQALDELKESIRRKGIIQAVTVRAMPDGTYQLISGERRMRAALEIGLHTVPAYIVEVHNDEEMLELALIENLQREHLNPIEIAISYQRLMHDVGLSAEQVADKVSKDRTTVVNFLRLLKLPTIIQDALRKGQITMGHARALVSLPSEHIQLKIYEKIVKKDLNVRQVERLVHDVGKKKEQKKPIASRSSITAIDAMTERMQQILATRVRVNFQEGGRGEIAIEFYTADDLGRLFDLIASLEQ